MRAIELLMQRRNTQAFIGADFATITIERHVKVRNDAGGLTSTPTHLAPITVKLARSRQVKGRPGEKPTVDGAMVRNYDRLIADPAADIQEDDRFVADGRTWRVTDFLSRRYELTAVIEML